MIRKLLLMPSRTSRSNKIETSLKKKEGRRIRHRLRKMSPTSKTKSTILPNHVTRTRAVPTRSRKPRMLAKGLRRLPCLMVANLRMDSDHQLPSEKNNVINKLTLTINK